MLETTRAATERTHPDAQEISQPDTFRTEARGDENRSFEEAGVASDADRARRQLNRHPRLDRSGDRSDFDDRGRNGIPGRIAKDRLISSPRAAWAATAIFRYGDRTRGLRRARFFLETQSPAVSDLPYDDTEGYVVGAALANLSTGPAIVTATILGADGTRLTVEQLS
jgi:hypothetical protein